MRTPAVALALAALAAGSAGQSLGLDIAGGLFNEPLRLTVSGGQPGDFWVLAFAPTQGPLPLGAVDPLDPRFLDLDIDMFSLPGFFGTVPAPDPTFVFVNTNPGLVGLHLYSQSFTLPGSPTLVDQISNGVVLVFAPGHGVSIDTLQLPLFNRAFLAGAETASGNHVLLGGNEGSLQGGTYKKVTEQFDRKLQTFTAGTDLQTERAFAAAVALDDGRVLICGGCDDLAVPQASADLYDPATNTSTPTGSMAHVRYFHSLVKLADGRVLALGGSTATDASSPIAAAIAIVSSATDSAEIYNPATGTWSNATAMPWKRTGVSAARLPDGTVLVAGGGGPGILSLPSFFATSGRYQPTTNSWLPLPNMPGSTRALATTTVLGDGDVLVTGGANGSLATLSVTALSDVTRFDAATNTWSAKASMLQARAGHSATYFPSNDTVVVCGGGSGDVLLPQVTKNVERFDGNAWTPIGQTDWERAFHYAARTKDGERVFLYGGVANLGFTPPTATAEFFAP